MASFHSNAVSLLCQFKQSPLDFFKLVGSQLVRMLLYEYLNLILTGVHQSHLGS